MGISGTLLRHVYDGLEAPFGRTDMFRASRLESLEAFRVAKGQNGAPALLISTTGEKVPQLNLRLENLSVDWDADCRVQVGDTTFQSRLTIISMPVEDDSLIEVFFSAAAVLIETVGTHPTL